VRTGSVRCAAIVPAAGRGERLGPGAPKALRTIAGAPILLHAVRGLLDSGAVDMVVVAAPPPSVDPQGIETTREMLAIFGDAVLIVSGGDTRQASVALALAAVPAEAEVLLVHDAARALTPPALIAEVVGAVRGGAGAVIPVLPVTDTIKAVDPSGTAVTGTVDRAGLRAVQTPQGFRREVLLKAHEAGALDSAETCATDDAGLVERIGLPVAVIPGHVEAFKVTTRFDLLLAEAVLAAR
jgi:2-C-methyl-D-erythritol 4-phosphate cytidylyltransferase